MALFEPFPNYVWNLSVSIAMAVGVVIGVVSGLHKKTPIQSGFDGMFLGNVPLGAGLSSSAALEMSGYGYPDFRAEALIQVGCQLIGDRWIT